MKKYIFSIALALSTALFTHAASLNVGDKAPDFELKGSDGKTYRLSEFKGKKPVVIAFFPKAFTPGCTKECKALVEQGEEIKKFDVAYFTASVDEAAKNKEFAESLNVNYPILSDPSKETAKAFGVLNERGMANRWTFYINKEGKIAYIDKKVAAETHGKDIAAQLKELGFASKAK